MSLRNQQFLGGFFPLFIMMLLPHSAATQILRFPWSSPKPHCPSTAPVDPWALLLASWSHLLLATSAAQASLNSQEFAANLIADVISSWVYRPTAAGSLITIIKCFMLQIRPVGIQQNIQPVGLRSLVGKNCKFPLSQHYHHGKMGIETHRK